MCGSEDFITIGAGLIVPWPAMLAFLNLERAGHRLMIDGDDVLVERGRGMPPIDPEDINALRRWKAHCWLVIRHLKADHGPAKRHEAVA